jgi:sigma-B regulation protein RsbU (phosphoserine phosphatase)
VDGRLVPARQVGGDFYDFFGLEGGRAALVIGDVAGKGVPAALLVSTVQSALRAYAGLRLEPLPLIQQLNRRVAQSVAAGRFVTLFYAELDPTAGTMRYVNAGHVWPRVRRANGDLESIPAGGVPLGIFEDATFEQGECRLGPGDSVLMYSDGIPDAINAFNHDFGEERIEQLWRMHGAGPTPAVLDRLMAAVNSFSGSAPQSDDQTVMVLCPAARG